MVFLLFVLCGLVYCRLLNQNPLYLLIAAVIFVALLIGIYEHDTKSREHRMIRGGRSLLLDRS